MSRWFGDNSAVLELETIVDRVKVNGVDIISWNAENRIVHFKVMVRPLKAVKVVHQALGEILRHAEN